MKQTFLKQSYWREIEIVEYSYFRFITVKRVNRLVLIYLSSYTLYEEDQNKHRLCYKLWDTLVHKSVIA